MPGHDWERIKSVFAAVRDLREPERTAMLNSLCDGDNSMADFVASLLRHDLAASVYSEQTRERIFDDGTLIAGRLRIVRFIDQGAMGEVYEAFDERIQRRVALKTIRSAALQADETLARFEREIRMSLEVSHPNLCRVFDYVESDTGIPCFTMELIDGESLASVIASERPLDMDRALLIIRQIAAGLDALHRRRILHRDLKPSNIMLTHDVDGALRVVIMDFGLARLLQPEDDLFETRVSTPMGAPYFMAPELLKEEKPGVASDLYAFGLVCDEMVTERRAFSATSLQSLYFAKLWEAPLSPTERNTSLPANWDAAILKCIAQDPEARFASAAEMVSALETVRPLAVAAAPTTQGGQLPAWRPRLRNAMVPFFRRPLAMTAGVAVLLTLLVLVLSPGARPPAPELVHVFDVEDTTGNPGTTYISRGTANELVRRLSRVDGIRVVPMRSLRTSAMQSIRSGIAVEGVLSGPPQQMILRVRLSDIASGAAIDSVTVNVREGEALQVENTVASQTASHLENHLRRKANPLQASMVPLLSWLRLNFLAASSNPAALPPTSNGAAFDAYLRGRQLLDEYSEPSVDASIGYLRRAVQADPRFALGYATLAEAQLNRMTFGHTPQMESLAAARKDAEQAISLDASLAEAQAAQAYVLQAEWHWQEAEIHYKRALLLKPEYAAARRRYAGLLLQFGRFAEAIPMAKQAFSEDPYDRGAIPGVGLYLYLAGQYQESVDFLEGQIGENDMQAARHNLGDSYAALAMSAPPEKRARYFDLALSQAARVGVIERKVTGPGGSTPMSDEMYAHYLTLKGDLPAAEPHLTRVVDLMDKGIASPANVAWIYAVRGDKERALDLLERALAVRDRRLFYVKTLPALQSLRNEPRFQAIVATMGL